MEKIYIIEPHNGFLKTLFPDWENIDMLPIAENADEELDAFIQNHLLAIKAQAFIIPVEMTWNGLVGLRLAMHIRLTPLLGLNRFTPIILVANRSLEDLLLEQKDQDKTALLTITKGTALCNFNPQDIEAHLQALSKINPLAFPQAVLNNIYLHPPTGSHALANLWGAFVFDKVANLHQISQAETIAQKQLYFKYLAAKNEDYSLVNRPIKKAKPKPDLYIATPRLKVVGKIDLNRPNSIPQKKRVLLIDDKADQYWAKVLQAFFKEANFQSIGLQNGESYADFKTRILQKIKADWDLILLDLRLNPLEESRSQKPEAYSGYEILSEIKLWNDGTQVIIFTASNKAWNLKTLLTDGVWNKEYGRYIKADGYYIKESPELNQDQEFVKHNFRNFRKQVKNAFAKNYLRRIYQEKEDLVEHLLRLHGHRHYIDMLEDIVVQLHFAYETLKLANPHNRFFAFAFLAFYKVFEILMDYYYRHKDNTSTLVKLAKVMKDNFNQPNDFRVLT